MVGALSLAQMVSWGTSYYGFAVLMVPFEQTFGATRAQVSLSPMFALLAGGATALLCSRVMQRGQFRALMTGGSVLAALGFSMLALAPNLAWVYAAWVLIGISSAATLYTPAFVLLTRAFPNDYRSKIMTLTLLGGLASTIFWPVLTALVSATDWRTTCWIIASLHLLLCACIHWLVIPSAASFQKTDNAAAHNNVPPLTSSQQKTAGFIAAYVMLESLAQAALSVHMIEILRSRGLSLGVAVGIASSFGLIQTLARGSVLAMGKRVAPGQMARAAVTLAPLSLIILAFASGNPWLALLFALVFGMGNGLSTIVRGTAVADLISPLQVAKLSGPLDLARALASASGPAVAALIYAHQGYDAVVITLALLFTLSATMVWLAWSRATKLVYE
jgi:predicted MFS family arabinose efflux permease